MKGVLLLWEPPFQNSVPLTGYALELRQNQGGWEVLDGSIPSSETQLLVPGLIKVRWERSLAAIFRGTAFFKSQVPSPVGFWFDFFFHHKAHRQSANIVKAFFKRCQGIRVVVSCNKDTLFVLVWQRQWMCHVV